MIFIGIDDTDTLHSPGTNQLARALVARVAHNWMCLRITRHQLLEHPRVPCTSKNGAASIVFIPRTEPGVAQSKPGSMPPQQIETLVNELRKQMLVRFVPGSDPGLCVAQSVSPAVVAFGRRCQREFVDECEARQLAADHGIHLEGLGGTQGGVIGALAAVGLCAAGQDGRIVQIAEWPDDLSGPQAIEAVLARGVQVRCLATGASVTTGTVDVGKHLRPNFREGKMIVFVRRTDRDATWEAVRLL